MLKLIIEFVGGPNDGQVLEGRLGDAGDAERYYLITHHGKVGQRFKVASPYAVETLSQEELREESPHHFQRHYYIVTDRLAEGDEVLVRAEYVESDGDHKLGADRHKQLEPTEAESRESRVRRYLIQMGQAMSHAYSHSWPAGDDVVLQRDISLHLAHVLLGERFSVFTDPPSSGPTNRTIPLLAVAPSQDWFLACDFRVLHDLASLPPMLESTRSLQSYWLGTELTVPACRPFVQRVAEHCQAGIGLMVCLHRVPDGVPTTEILDFWKSHTQREPGADQSPLNFAPLEADWMEPFVVQRFPKYENYYLLSLFFPIRHGG
jgi:hypothetical protein